MYQSINIEISWLDIRYLISDIWPNPQCRDNRLNYSSISRESSGYLGKDATPTNEIVNNNVGDEEDDSLEICDNNEVSIYLY